MFGDFSTRRVPFIDATLAGEGTAARGRREHGYGHLPSDNYFLCVDLTVELINRAMIFHINSNLQENVVAGNKDRTSVRQHLMGTKTSQSSFCSRTQWDGLEE